MLKVNDNIGTEEVFSSPSTSSLTQFALCLIPAPPSGFAHRRELSAIRTAVLASRSFQPARTFHCVSLDEPDKVTRTVSSQECCSVQTIN